MVSYIEIILENAPKCKIKQSLGSMTFLRSSRTTVTTRAKESDLKTQKVTTKAQKSQNLRIIVL